MNKITYYECTKHTEKDKNSSKRVLIVDFLVLKVHMKSIREADFSWNTLYQLDGETLGSLMTYEFGVLHKPANVIYKT